MSEYHENVIGEGGAAQAFGRAQSSLSTWEEGARSRELTRKSSLSGEDRFRWPELAQLGLSTTTLAARAHSIGGSDVNVILSGDEARIHRLWQEKRGEAEPEDLSSKLAVMLGCWTEDFNRQWYVRLMDQEISRIGERLACEIHDWRSATLDGYVERLGAVFEAKHTSPFVTAEDLLARYMPQLQHNMAVAGCEMAVLSVIFGNTRWECFEVAADWLYQADLLEAEQRFWDCVQSGTPPVALAPPPAPKPIGVREVCLEGNNAWASSAADWLQHRLAAKKHAEATSNLKSQVEDDVARAFGHGIEVKRSKAGALSIRPLGRELTA
jgi:predicted phage-related endonuclease